MNRMIAKSVVSFAVISAMVLTAAGQCDNGSAGGPGPGGGVAQPATVPTPSDCGWNIYDSACATPPPQGPVPVTTVSANPAATNPGAGTVTGVCHFSIQGPSGDTSRDSGMSVRRISPVSYIVSGIVWGYCTDTLSSFTLDLYLGYYSGNTPQVVAHRTITQAPGPVQTPFAVTTPCVPGTYQLTVQYLATDQAGNVISGKFGGKTRLWGSADCGIPG